MDPATLILGIVGLLATLFIGLWQVNLARKQVRLAEPSKKDATSLALTSPCAKRIPPCEDHSWHSKISILEKKFSSHPHVFVVGTNGCGSVQLGLYLLKKHGFAPSAVEPNCHFVPVEFRSHKTFSDALDAIFTSIGASKHSKLPTSEKIIKIQRIAQDKDLAILAQDVEVLSEFDKDDFRSFLTKLSERAHVFITSTKPYPNHWPIDEEVLSNLSIEDVKKYAQSIATVKGITLDDGYLGQLPELQIVTHGHYDCIQWALQAKNSRDLARRIAELKEGGGAIRNIISQFFQNLPDEKKILLCLITTFGGSVSRLTLINSNPYPIINIDAFIRELIENLVATEYPNGNDFYIKIPQGNAELIKAFQFQIPDSVIEGWANYLINWYYSLDEVNGTRDIHPTFDNEIDLIDQLSKWLIDNNHFDKANDFYRATCELLFNRGFFEQRVAYGSRIAQALEENGHYQFASWIHASAASVNTLLSQYDQAQAGLTKAVEIAKLHGFNVEVLRAMRAIAGLHYRKGSVELAELEINQLLSDNNMGADKFNKVDALYVKSGIEIFTKKYDDARLSLEEMKLVSTEIGWTRGSAYADLELAILLATKGSFQEAFELANSALEVSKKYGDRRQIARCELTLGKIILSTSSRWAIWKSRNNFNEGIRLIQKATREFDSLRMDNEANEAKSVIDQVNKLSFLKKIFFEPYYNMFPIGGD